MDALNASGMQPVTVFAPVRTAILGMIRLIFGLLVGVAAVAVLWAVSVGEMKPTKPGDMPVWWMYLVGLALAFAAFSIATGGIGRMVSAFARSCCFLAGPAGLLIRVPKNGWFGRFRIIEHAIGWDEIEQIIYFVHRINLIPVSRELRLKLSGERMVVIERHFFSASVKELQGRLLSMLEVAGR